MTDDLHALPAETGVGQTSDGLTVSLLGPMRVEYGDRLLHVAGPQRRRLLAVLALRAGDVVPVDGLIDAMWGDDPPASAAKTVQSHVVRLRQSLAAVGEAIETAPGGYRLHVDAARIDVHIFDRWAAEGSAELRVGHPVAAARLLESAIALWRGPALAEFAGAAFATGMRVRLEERRLAAVEDLAEARLTLGQTSAVIGEMERMVADDPGRERAWALLMRALYADGRQHHALAAFQRARTALAEEYGLEPGAELRDLERRILRNDPALSVLTERTLPPALRDRTPLVGRNREIAWLRAAWALATRGDGQVRAITGPTGSGRTRVLAELAAIASAEGGAVEYCTGPHGLPLDDDGRGPGAIIDATAERCRSVPLLIVVDDVDWAPPTTIDALRALAGAAERMPLMVVLVGHAQEGPGGRLIEDLAGSGGVVDLPPLTDEEIAAVVRTDGLDEDAVMAAVAVADGLPGVAKREAALWAERTAAEQLQVATSASIGARTVAAAAGASVLHEVLRLVDARSRRAALLGAGWMGRQPYRSLASYAAADAELFVGRERLVAELTARVLDRRLVAVVGASGAGKSSLVRAGLLPLVRSGRLPGGQPWRTHVILPSADRAAVLAAIDTIDGLDNPGPQLLVIDQFEELAAVGVVDEVAARLLDLVMDPALDVHVVVVVRADQLAAVVASHALAELLDDTQVLVPPPSDDELRRIVVEPARRTGCTVEQELVTAIANDIAGHEAALPLVSAALAEVWERREGDTLTVRAYREIGGLAAAIERMGERALQAVGVPGHDAVRGLMLRLVDVTDDGSWVRRRVPVAEVPTGWWPAVDALVDARLVSRTEHELDVVHEVVFRGWSRMVAWLAEARADLVLERDLRAAARSWDLQGRNDDGVLRGGRLEVAAEWAARRGSVPQLVTEFLDASRAWAEADHRAVREQLRREQRARKRLRTSLVAAVVLLVVALVGTGLAVVSSRRADTERQQADAQRRRADTAASDARSSADRAETAASLLEVRRSELLTARLVADSDANVERDLALSMLLAVEAWHRADTPATRGALLDTLTHNTSAQRGAPTGQEAGSAVRHHATSFQGFVSGPVRLVYGLELSADGGIAVTVGDNELLVFDTEARTLVGRIAIDGGGASVRPDGDAVLVMQSKSLRVFDVATATMRPFDVPLADGLEFVRAFYVEGGRRIAVATTDHAVRLFDAATAEAIQVQLPDSPVDLTGVAPDGTIAIGTTDGVSFWATTGTLVRSVTLESPGDVRPTAYAFSRDMHWLAGHEPQGRLVIWDLTTGLLQGDPADRPTLVRSVAFDPNDPTILAVGSADGTVTMMDVPSNRPIGRPMRAQLGGIRAIAYADDGRVMITATDDGTLALWGDNGGPSLLSAPLVDNGALVGASGDGGVVAVAVDDLVTVRHLREPALASLDIALTDHIARTVDPSAFPMPWVLSEDGSTIVGGIVGGTGSEVVVIDTTDGTAQLHVRIPEFANPVDISDDGRVLAISAGTRLEVWDVEQATRVLDFDLTRTTAGAVRTFSRPALSPDGRRVAVALSDTVVVVDVATETWIVLPSPELAQGRLDYMSSGTQLIGAGVRGQIRMWDLASGATAAEGRSTDATSLFGVFVSTNGSLVAAIHPFTASVALFDPSTLARIGDPIPTGTVDDLHQPMLSADGRFLYADDVFGRATRWVLDPAEWQRIACHAAGRNLTLAEFARYFGSDEPYHVTCEEWPAAS